MSVAISLFSGLREKNKQLGKSIKTGGLITVEGLEARMGNGEVSNAEVEQVREDACIGIN